MDSRLSGTTTLAARWRNLSRHDLGFLGVAALIAIAMVTIHVIAGMTLPAPWGDEAFFVWQARAFERFNNFAAPELDATRPILLLPYLYQTVMGLAFKLFGYSFELARALSLAFTLTGFGFLAATVRRGSAPIAALVLIGGFMMSSVFVTMANNARMEAMLFAVICAALLLIQLGRGWFAVALLVISPMIHPNGILFLVPAAAHAVINLKIHRTRPDRAALITFGVAAIAWLANGLYAVSNWAGLMHDIAYRLSETTTANSGWAQYGGWHAVGLGLIILTGVVGRWRKVRIGHFIAFAIGSWLMHRLRIETWYEVFGGLAYMLLSLAVIEITVKEAPALLKARLPSVPRWTIAPALVIALAAVNIVAGHIPGPKGYVEDLKVDGMVVASNNVSYLTGEDRQSLESYILAKQAGGAKTFEVYPWGDTLLLGNLTSKGVQFQIPYFDPAFSAGASEWPWGFGPNEWPTADVYIIRNSRYQPRWLDDRFKMVIERAEKRTGAKVELIRSRDATEVWYAVDARKK